MLLFGQKTRFIHYSADLLTLLDWLLISNFCISCASLENVGSANPIGGRFCLVELLAVRSWAAEPAAVMKDTFGRIRAVLEASFAVLMAVAIFRLTA